MIKVLALIAQIWSEPAFLTDVLFLEAVDTPCGHVRRGYAGRVFMFPVLIPTLETSNPAKESDVFFKDIFCKDTDICRRDFCSCISRVIRFKADKGGILKDDNLSRSDRPQGQDLSVKMPLLQRVSDLLCMSNLAHASKLKEHDNDDDFQGSFRRAAERR